MKKGRRIRSYNELMVLYYLRRAIIIPGRVRHVPASWVVNMSLIAVRNLIKNGIYEMPKKGNKK
jgi:hypothetical protein